MMRILPHERKRSAEASFHPLVTLTRIPNCRWTVHPSVWGRGRTSALIAPPPLLFLVCTEAERGPAGYAATVGLRPRVWRLGLRPRAKGRRGRARYGERQTKRCKLLNEVSEHFALGPLSESGLQLEKLRVHWAVEATPAFPSVLYGATLPFFF